MLIPDTSRLLMNERVRFEVRELCETIVQSFEKKKTLSSRHIIGCDTMICKKYLFGPPLVSGNALPKPLTFPK